MPRRCASIAILLSIGTLPISLLVPAIRREIRARLSNHTVTGRLTEIAPRVEPLWRERLGVSPSQVQQLSIVALKNERQVHVYARVADTNTRLTTYPILAASGGLGPKLREGDRQVPEGLYAIESLNPNSRFHLALRVNYPSQPDHDAARADGRDTAGLGGDIMIHGGAASIGCVAIGDGPIEELFWLVASVGLERVEIVLAPSFAPASLIRPETPAWLVERYQSLERRLGDLGVN